MSILGGTKSPMRARANYRDARIGAPSPVGLFPMGATPEGIQDLAGNVWEWVADWYGGLREGKQRNPRGREAAEYRVLRGGAWRGDAADLRAAFRHRSRA